MKDTRTIYKDVFSGENDTVVPTAMVREILNSHTVTVLEGEGHRIENVAPIVDAINQAINNFS